ncbi:MAG: hypothetical protein JNK78_18805 [Planctomycetes bacterium]|nr:hypothetical protein [Planctomycetota bacterium]
MPTLRVLAVTRAGPRRPSVHAARGGAWIDAPLRACGAARRLFTPSIEIAVHR